MMSQDIEQTTERVVATAINPSLYPASELNWRNINWKKIEQHVRRLQERIYRATKKKQYKKVRSLQKLLARSYHTKLYAIREVTKKSSGKNTPGVDSIVITTDHERWELSQQEFDYRSHRPRPVKRIFIPKNDGSQRPLGIPTIKDRIMQTIVTVALEAEWEAKFEPHSFGFRPGKSAMDAIETIRKNLAWPSSSQWVLDADISKCFDEIQHKAILERIPEFQQIIARWLKAGVVEFGTYSKTEKGTPQGGVISPLLANITLHGMERLFKNDMTIVLVRYADDFVVIAPSKEVLETYVLPKIKFFLQHRGLSINGAKTKIVHRTEGFDFLGFNLTYRHGKRPILLITPQKKKISKFLQKAKEILATLHHTKVPEVIQRLNLLIRGWTNYYRHVNSKNTFTYLHHKLNELLWKRLKRQHPQKSSKWILDTYYTLLRPRRWKEGNNTGELFDPIYVFIVRYVKSDGLHNPFERGRSSPSTKGSSSKEA